MNENLVRLGVLESYGVRWSADDFARDIVQNFYDSTPDFSLVRLVVDKNSRTVVVAGPHGFDIDLLCYVGATTKHDGSTVGGFGEGFKICALIGVRDFGVAMSAGTGSHSLEVTFAPTSIGRELCYRITTLPEPESGSWVRLENCSDVVLGAFDRVVNVFRWDGNRHIGPILASTEDGALAIALSNVSPMGEIYYRRQYRGKMRFWSVNRQTPAVTLIHDAVLDEIEGDRDRRDVPVRPIARALGKQLPPDGLHRVFLHLEYTWEYGHDCLGGLLEGAKDRGLQLEWPPDWLVRAHPDPHNFNDLAKRQGYRLAVTGLAHVGMRRVDQRFGTGLETRQPTDLERARLAVTVDLYRDLVGKSPKTNRFEVYDSQHAAVLGQHLGDRVLVGAHLVAQGFDAVASTVIHELAHDAGPEDSERFHRRLGNALRGILRQPDRVQKARERFEKVTEADAPPLKTDDPVAESQSLEEKRKSYPWLRKNAWMESADPDNGWPVAVFVPVGFPPLVDILKRIDDAASAVQMEYIVIPFPTQFPTTCIKEKLPGLPWIRICGVDVGEDTHEPGYRARSWDGELVPPVELLTAAFLKAKETVPFKKRMERITVAVPTPESELSFEQRRAKHLANCRTAVSLTWSGWSQTNPPAWSKGMQHAAFSVFLRNDWSETPPDDVPTQIKPILQLAIDYARKLRAEDVQFESGDEFEESAMATAQGLSVAVYLEREDEGDPDRAADVFHRFRAITNDLLSTPIPDIARNECLKRTVGLITHTTNQFQEWARPLAVDSLEDIYTTAKNAVLAFCSELEDDDIPIHRWEYQFYLWARQYAEATETQLNSEKKSDPPTLSEAEVGEIWLQICNDTGNPVLATQTIMDLTKKDTAP